MVQEHLFYVVAVVGVVVVVVVNVNFYFNIGVVQIFPDLFYLSFS